MDILEVKDVIKKSAADTFKRFYAGKGQILMFHRILPSAEKPRIRNTGLEVSPGKLEEVIQFFQNLNYAFINLDDLPHYLKAKDTKFVIFTFDDGYVDNLTVALPIFQKHNIPFTVYVTTDFPEGKAVMWWYLLEELLFKKYQIRFPYREETFSFRCKNLDEKEEVFAQLRRVIIDMEPIERMELFQKLFVENGIDLYQTTRENALSWKQLKELSTSDLVTIGAHTVTHPALSGLSPEQIKEEVLGGKTLLEEKLGIKIEHFSYPFGSRKEANQREFKILKELGFKTATTTRSGNIFKEHLKAKTALPRLYIGPKTTETELKDFITGRTPFQKGVFHRVVKE